MTPPTKSSGLGASVDWLPEHPERINDPAIRRSPLDRALTALIRLVTRGRSFEVFRAISVRRGLLRPFLSYNSRLMPFGKLPRRQTELVILRVAIVCRAKYEWAQHVPIARRTGIEPDEIEAVAAGAYDRLPPVDAKLLEAADELLANHVLGDGMYAALAEFLDPPQMLEFCLLAGHYAALAGALNTMGVALEPAMRR